MRGNLPSALVLIVIVFGFIGVLLATTGRFGPIGNNSGNGAGVFKMVYDPPAKSTYVQMEQNFKQSGAFEQIADALNTAYFLPRDLEMHLSECGIINCYYDPQTGELHMCYEMMEYIYTTFANYAKDQQELELATGDSILFILFHEMGHALIDIYNLPITGKEEDAVDQLSTLIMIEEGEKGEEAAIYGASFFGLMAAQNQNTEGIPYWDTHSLDAQRFYNILCWVYGKSPQKYASLVTDGTLPQQRAASCQYEYQQIKTSWNTLLAPYAKK